MRTVEIPKDFLKLNKEYYYVEIPDIECDYDIEQELLDHIESIHGSSCLLAYYVVYLIVSENTLLPNIKTPRTGLPFFDKITNTNLSIYHAHLEDNNVLIWYVDKNDSNDLILRIKCIKHPNKYDSIIKEIMLLPNSYDTINDRYMKDNINNTYLKENKFILMFKEFFKLS